jgi:hypothetical protein
MLLPMCSFSSQSASGSDGFFDITSQVQMIASAHSIDSGERLHLVEIPNPTVISASTSSPTQKILVMVISSRKNCS